MPAVQIGSNRPHSVHEFKRILTWMDCFLCLVYVTGLCVNLFVRCFDIGA